VLLGAVESLVFYASGRNIDVGNNGTAGIILPHLHDIPRRTLDYDLSQEDSVGEVVSQVKVASSRQGNVDILATDNDGRR